MNDTKDKLETDLKGVTVDGIPAVDFIALEDGIQKKIEVLKLFQEETKTIIVPKHIRYQEKKYVPHSRVRKLSDEQIRQEYGTMAKPYETMNENVVDVILRKGPISNIEISNETGYPHYKVVGCTSHIFRKFQMAGHPGVLVDKEAGFGLYSFVKELLPDVPTVISEYRRLVRQNYQPRQKLSKHAVCEHHPKLSSVNPSVAVSDLVKELIQSAIGVEVRVSGGIKIEVVLKMEPK